MANAIFAPPCGALTTTPHPSLFCYFSFILLLKYAFQSFCLSFILLLKYAFQSFCQQAQLACACPVRASPARLFSIQTFLHTPIKTLSHKLSVKRAPARICPRPAGLLLQPPVRGTPPIVACGAATAARTTCSLHTAHRCLWRGHCPRLAGYTQPASTLYPCPPLDCRVRRINAPLSQ